MTIAIVVETVLLLIADSQTVHNQLETALTNCNCQWAIRCIERAPFPILATNCFLHFTESTVLHSITHIADIRNSTVNKLWTETYKLNVLYKENWTTMAIKEIEQFQMVLVKALKDGYSPGDENKFHTRWSFIDSWLFSISIITTTGK